MQSLKLAASQKNPDEYNPDMLKFKRVGKKLVERDELVRKKEKKLLDDLIQPQDDEDEDEFGGDGEDGGFDDESEKIDWNEKSAMDDWILDDEDISKEELHKKKKLRVASEVKLFNRDLTFLNSKKSLIENKRKKLEEEVAFIGSSDSSKPKHTIFVDSKKEMDEFDASKHFNTPAELVSRSWNRPTFQTLNQLKQVISDDIILSSAVPQKKMIEKLKSKEKIVNKVLNNLEMKRAILVEGKDKVESKSVKNGQVSVVFKRERRR